MSTFALGWDVHRKFSKVSLQEMTTEGQIGVLERARLEHYDRQAMRQWLGRVPAGTPVALEAAFGWPWIGDLLEEVGPEPHLGHPPAIKVLAQHEAKDDRCNANRPAKFQLRGILRESCLAPPEVRQRRERLRDDSEMTSGFGRSHARQSVGGADLHGLATVVTTEVILERFLRPAVRRRLESTQNRAQKTGGPTRIENHTQLPHPRETHQRSRRPPSTTSYALTSPICCANIRVRPGPPPKTIGIVSCGATHYTQ